MLWKVVWQAPTYWEPYLEMGRCFSTRWSYDRPWPSVFKILLFQSLSRLWSRTGRASIAASDNEIEQILCKICALRGKKSSFTMAFRALVVCNHSSDDLRKTEVMLNSFRSSHGYKYFYGFSYNKNYNNNSQVTTRNTSATRWATTIKLSPPQRPLWLWGGLGERKREFVGNDGKEEERREASAI